MPASHENCTDNVTYTRENFYYLIQVFGDPEFRLTAKSARKNGIKAEFLPEGWVYQNKKDAEEIAKRWTYGKRLLKVVLWYAPLLTAIWNSTKSEASRQKSRLDLNWLPID